MKNVRYLHRHAWTYCTDISTRLSGSTMMAFSSSSDTSTQEVKEDLIMLMTRSLDRMSSFFTWSPVTFVLPAMPYLPGEEQTEVIKPWIKAILSEAILHYNRFLLNYCTSEKSLKSPLSSWPLPWGNVHNMYRVYLWPGPELKQLNDYHVVLHKPRYHFVF